jgi:hypothetical protein
MHTQSSVSASDASSMPLWNQFKLIAHLPARTTIQMQHATVLSADLCTWRRGLQKMRLWCEQRHGWFTYMRSALEQSDGTIFTTGVMTLLSTWLTLLIRLASSFQQRERQPCQE